MSSAPTSLENVVVKYWPLGGRGEPIYLLLEDAGVAYEKEEVSSKDPEEYAAYNADKFDYAKYPFNQLPVVKVNGLYLAQQDAILRYLTKILGSIEDLNRSYTAAVYSEDFTTQLLIYCQTTAPKILGQCEYLLSLSKGPKGTFIASEKPCFPEFTLLHLVFGLLILKPSSLKPFPLLDTWYSRMTSRDGIAAYLASGRKYINLNGSRNGVTNGQSQICE